MSEAKRPVVVEAVIGTFVVCGVLFVLVLGFPLGRMVRRNSYVICNIAQRNATRSIICNIAQRNAFTQTYGDIIISVEVGGGLCVCMMLVSPFFFDR